jgi:hypothetical protein
MTKFKFLALVMLASAVAVSSTSAFAHTHKRTHHYRSFNSMNMIKGPLERQPSWRSSPAPSFLSEPDASKWGGGAGGGGGGAGGAGM